MSVKIPDGNVSDVQNRYKNIGVLWINGINEEATRKPSTAGQILKSQLNGKNKVQAANTHTHCQSSDTLLV